MISHNSVQNLRFQIRFISLIEGAVYALKLKRMHKSSKSPKYKIQSPGDLAPGICELLFHGMKVTDHSSDTVKFIQMVSYCNRITIFMTLIACSTTLSAYCFHFFFDILAIPFASCLNSSENKKKRKITSSPPYSFFACTETTLSYNSFVQKLIKLNSRHQAVSLTTRPT